MKVRRTYSMGRLGGTFMLFILCCHDSTSLTVDMQPASRTVRPGAKVDFLCKSPEPLDFCRITLPGRPEVSLKPTTAPNKEFNYHGRGLENGECGVQLESAEEKHNGEVKCTVGLEGDRNGVTSVARLTVAVSPESPALELTPRAESFREGADITATCRVKNGRPAADITLLLDGVGIKSENETSKEGGDLYTAVATLKRNLTWEDHGKVLTCVSKHVALDNAVNDTATLTVTYKPRDSPTKVVVLEELKTTGVQVQVMANPQPRFTWTIRDVTLQEDDERDRFHALESQQLGPGKWNVSLLVKDVTDQDIGMTFVLNAKNQEGENKYQVTVTRLATTTKPAKTTEPARPTEPTLLAEPTEPGSSDENSSLGPAGVIGILILVLGSVGGIGLAVFARLQRRWCFAENHRSIPQSED